MVESSNVLLPQGILDLTRAANARFRKIDVNHDLSIAQTPLDEIDSYWLKTWGFPEGCRVFLKREDRTPVRSFKVRGAVNAIASWIENNNLPDSLVTASAGNHAQGVALAARLFQIHTKIYMPSTAPLAKQEAVRRFGKEHVEIVLVEGGFDAAAAAARQESQSGGGPYIHPFDNLDVIAGQGTIALEVVDQIGQFDNASPLDYAFLQIGGGGLAAGVSAVLKDKLPEMQIMGVEGMGQASMQTSIAADTIQTLSQVDRFADGTAVATPGQLTFEFCRHFIDEFFTVSNEEIKDGVRFLFDMGIKSEPSGAMGMAGLISYVKTPEGQKALAGKDVLVVLSGANVDAAKYAEMLEASSPEITKKTRYMKFYLPEKSGELLEVLGKSFKDINITGFFYGKIDRNDASPMIAFPADDAEYVVLQQALTQAGIVYSDQTNAPHLLIENVNVRGDLCSFPLLLGVSFEEKKGALREFMANVVDNNGNLCFLKYKYTGEEQGAAIACLEFENIKDRSRFINMMSQLTAVCREMEEDCYRELLGSTPHLGAGCDSGGAPKFHLP